MCLVDGNLVVDRYGLGCGVWFCVGSLEFCVWEVRCCKVYIWVFRMLVDGLVIDCFVALFGFLGLNMVDLLVVDCYLVDSNYLKG